MLKNNLKITWSMHPPKTFWTISECYLYVEPLSFTVFALFNEEIRFLSLMDEIFLKRIESSTWVLLMKGRTFWTVIEFTWEESIFNKLIEAKFILTTFYSDVVMIYVMHWHFTNSQFYWSAKWGIFAKKPLAVWYHFPGGVKRRMNFSFQTSSPRITIVELFKVGAPKMA